MNAIWIALITLSLGVNEPPSTNRTDGAAVTAETPESIEKEYDKLVEDDDAAAKEVEGWIREANAFENKGAPGAREALVVRIEQRLEPIRKAYEEFLRKHPNHVEGHLAYGSFLNETTHDYEGMLQWEIARQLDPKNPAAWNNLANYYGHAGEVTKSFDYYAKAIELNPKEPVYFQNLATTTYLFRKDAMEHYHITEPEVFDRALDLYRKALALDPTNLALATDLAQSYYGIKPMRVTDALAAWNDALKLAKNDVERQGVYLHLARVELNSGRFDEARRHLDLVNQEEMQVLKNRLARNLREKESAAKGGKIDSSKKENE